MSLNDYDAFGTVIEESVITFTAETGNLAVSKIAVSSSDESTNLISTKSIDGNVGTRWSSNESDNEWIYVDLGSALDINKVILKWETAYGKEYKIQVSNNAVDWVDVYYTNSENGGLDEITFASTNARYVRMLGIKRGTVWGYSLYEFQVFGIQIIEENTNNPYRYAGYQYDEESDLYYLNARYYDSKIARFMSEDTYRGQKNDPLSLNLYSYVSNNPVRYTDPTGHMQKGDDAYDIDTKAQLIALTNAYYAATTKEERKAISDQATIVRGNAPEHKNQETWINKQDDVASKVNQAVLQVLDKKDYMSADDWKTITNDLGITSKSKTDPLSYLTLNKSTTTVTTFGYTEISINVKQNLLNHNATASMDVQFKGVLYYDSLTSDWQKELIGLDGAFNDGELLDLYLSIKKALNLDYLPDEAVAQIKDSKNYKDTVTAYGLLNVFLSLWKTGSGGNNFNYAYASDTISISTTQQIEGSMSLKLLIAAISGNKDNESTNQLNEKINKKDLPTEGEINFEIKGRDLTYNKDLGGYVDKYGNIWRKGPYHGDPKLDFSFEWDVELSKKGINMWGEYLNKGKSYINVRPDGYISH